MPEGLRTLLLSGLLTLALISPGAVLAAVEEPWYDQVRDNLQQTYAQGATEIYLPFRTYHWRSVYTRAQIDSYQEHPFGLGLGRGRSDDQGNWREVYVVGFQDSHFMPQWMAGYTWKARWQAGEDVRLDLGYTAFLVARADTFHYSPVPGAVPVAAIELHNWSLEAAYVPGNKHYGNVVLFWVKVNLSP